MWTCTSARGDRHDHRAERGQQVHLAQGDLRRDPPHARHGPLPRSRCQRALRPQMVAAGASFVPQTDNVFPSLSVRENLEMGGYAREDGLDARIDELLALFPDLAARAGQRASRLSGGQRQALAIGRALMLDPILLLLDEPTASLSPIMRGEIFERLLRVRGRRRRPAHRRAEREGGAVHLRPWLRDGHRPRRPGAERRGTAGQRRCRAALPRPRGRARPSGTRPRRAGGRRPGGPLMDILQLVVVGIIVGSIIGLGAIGLTLTYGVMKFANFAHGDLMTLGMFLALFIVSDLGLGGGKIGASLLRLGDAARRALRHGGRGRCRPPPGPPRVPAAARPGQRHHHDGGRLAGHRHRGARRSCR